jgi:hypothetical protein
MAKSDFEFYTMPGVEGEFVVPAPASDPYHGAYEVPAIPALAIDNIARVVSEHIGPTEVQIGTAPAEEMDGYFFSKMGQGYDVLSQKAKISVLLDKEDGYYTKAFSEIYGELALGPEEIMIPLQRDPVIDRWPTTPQIKCEKGGIEYDFRLIDDDDQPVHPSLTIRQFVWLRAYKWLPGRTRKSYLDNGILPRNYSPRPVNLAVAQLVEVNGINPKVS